MSNEHLRRWILAVSLGIAVLAEAVSSALTAVFTGENGLVFDTEPIPPMPLYIIAGGTTAVVIILLCLELTFRYPDVRWIRPIVHTG